MPFEATITSIHRMTPRVKQFVVEAEEPFDFEPGQHTTSCRSSTRSPTRTGRVRPATYRIASTTVSTTSTGISTSAAFRGWSSTRRTNSTSWASTTIGCSPRVGRTARSRTERALYRLDGFTIPARHRRCLPKRRRVFAGQRPSIRTRRQHRRIRRQPRRDRRRARRPRSRPRRGGRSRVRYRTRPRGR